MKKLLILVFMLSMITTSACAKDVTLYKVGDNNTAITVEETEVMDYVKNYEWSIEPTTLMYNANGLSSWIWNSEIDVYKERGWSLTPQARFTYSVFTKSNLSVEQLNVILSGTGLAGYGQAFYDMEQTYGVNSLFAIAVGSHESANFYKTANVHNYFGFRGTRGWMKFASPNDCINYFGKLMHNSLYYGKSIEQIAVIYCNSSWAKYVKAHMYEKWQKVGI